MFENYRRDFPVCDRFAYLNHAALAPMSRRVTDVLTSYLKERQYGTLQEQKWFDKVQQVRGQAAKLIGADIAEIAFCSNVTTGASWIAHGLDWQKGDEIIVPINQFPANVYPWTNLRQKGVKIITPKIPRNDSAAETVLRHVNSRTRLVALSFVEYDDGFVQPIKTIADQLADHASYLFVDAVQGLGAVPLNVHQLAIDFLATSGHKWLLGPIGQGFLYIREQLLSSLLTTSLGWLSVKTPFDFQDYDQPFLTSAQKWEGGSLNLIGITALGESLQVLLEVGIDAIYSQIKNLNDLLVAQVLSLGYHVHTNMESFFRSGIISLSHPRIETMKIYNACVDGGIAISERNGRIRVSPHFYNNEQDIDRLVEIFSVDC